ncbi:jg6369 [Pararge aegeria aegeria]|uniref:Jg6369 protein n=1 Tax=Pararge aegeria aegeria TaxID=348720 RepID=A0A8S4RUP6_9NEOP|nr:jg6369 [Pararge aegeria aegeria]
MSVSVSDRCRYGYGHVGIGSVMRKRASVGTRVGGGRMRGGAARAPHRLSGPTPPANRSRRTRASVRYAEQRRPLAARSPERRFHTPGHPSRYNSASAGVRTQGSAD